MGWTNQETRLALKRKGGDREWWEQFLSNVANGESLRELCQAELLAVGEVLRWVSEDDGRQKELDKALKVAAEVKVLEAMEIADDETVEVARAKLRIDTRYRQAAKWSPGRYGERSVLEHTGRVEMISITGALEEARRRVEMGRVVDAEVIEERRAEIEQDQEELEAADSGLIPVPVQIEEEI